MTGCEPCRPAVGRKRGSESRHQPRCCFGSCTPIAVASASWVVCRRRTAHRGNDRTETVFFLSIALRMGGIGRALIQRAPNTPSRSLEALQPAPRSGGPQDRRRLNQGATSLSSPRDGLARTYSLGSSERNLASIDFAISEAAGPRLRRSRRIRNNSRQTLGAASGR